MYALAELCPAPRDDHWLRAELDRIWDTFFPDVSRINSVQVSFARYWTTRLGSISLCHADQSTQISINAFLRHEEVPEFVHHVTLAHELVHYTHGFGSPLPQRFAHPHKGGVVIKELRSRGLGSEQHACQHWIREHWRDLCSRKLRLVRLD